MAHTGTRVCVAMKSVSHTPSNQNAKNKHGIHTENPAYTSHGGTRTEGRTQSDMTLRPGYTQGRSKTLNLCA
jgi:hypothetical protein